MSATSDPASPVSATNAQHATLGNVYLVVDRMGGVPESIHATSAGAEAAAAGMPGGFEEYTIVVLAPHNLDRINAIAGRTPDAGGSENGMIKAVSSLECWSPRDRFAAAVLTGVLASYSTEAYCRAVVDGAVAAGRTVEQHIAFNCYKLADAMLAARQPSPSPVAAADPAPGDPEAEVLAKAAKVPPPDATSVPPSLTKAEHAPGRAVYREMTTRVVGENGNVLALCYYADRLVRQAIAIANARRFFAMWNACLDVPTDVLELIGSQQSPTERLGGLCIAADTMAKPIIVALADEDYAAIEARGAKFDRELRLLLRNAQPRQPGQAQPLVDR